MDLEDISGLSFLMVLSSQKSLAYWERLKLPVGRNRYSDAMHFASAALELVFYPAVAEQEGIYSFQESWKDYRQSSGVLSDEFLEKHQINMKGQFDNHSFHEVLSILKEGFDFAESDAVYEWYLKYFRDSEDSIIESVKRLDFLVEETKKDTTELIYNKEILEPHFERIRKFHNQVVRRNDSLERHFRVAFEVYQMTLPDEWEMVLQDYFMEGYRNSYYWMSAVEYTLQYINFRERWQELKEDIGLKNTDLLINWLEITLAKLPRPYYQLKSEDLERLRNL